MDPQKTFIVDKKKFTAIKLRSIGGWVYYMHIDLFIPHNYLLLIMYIYV